jgi:fructose-bisphosphate aldolase class II
MTGVREYFNKNSEYLKLQIGNPDGDDIPNKKNYDPRKWVREAEVTFVDRLKQAFKDLNNVNTL